MWPTWTELHVIHRVDWPEEGTAFWRPFIAVGRTEEDADITARCHFLRLLQIVEAQERTSPEGE